MFDCRLSMCMSHLSMTHHCRADVEVGVPPSIYVCSVVLCASVAIAPGSANIGRCEANNDDAPPSAFAACCSHLLFFSLRSILLHVPLLQLGWQGIFLHDKESRDIF